MAQTDVILFRHPIPPVVIIADPDPRSSFASIASMPLRKPRCVAAEDMYTLQDDTRGKQVPRSGPRRVKGFLKSIPNMPVDILHEVRALN